MLRFANGDCSAKVRAGLGSVGRCATPPMTLRAGSPVAKPAAVAERGCEGHPHMRQGSTRSGGIPDMAFINAKVPISEVATALGLHFGASGHIHCWHPDRHQNGDRTASVGICRQQNYVKCFGCGTPPMHTLNLVIDVLGIPAGDAALWIAERFEVPRIPRTTPPRKVPSVVTRVGVGPPLTPLIVSGLYARMSESARNVATVLAHLADKEDARAVYSIRISYVGILRYGGMASPNAVRKGLRELAELRWLSIKQSTPESGHPLRSVPTYVITPQSDTFLEIANASAAALVQEIAVEKELRARKRNERTQTLRSGHESIAADLKHSAKGGYYDV